MTRLKRLIVEIHHRSLWQVLLIYCGAALVAYQAVQALTEGLGLPQWFPAFAIVLFIVGLPIVLATAFVHEVAPPTVKPAEPAPLTEAEAARIEAAAAAAHLEARRRHRFLTGRNAVASFVVALAAWGVVATGWLVLHEPDAAPSSERKSVAVLPFANLSGDPDNEYFSDGITGDIINHLARIADLKVISRTSVMQYRDTERSLREIGEELAVATVLEGEVQRIGDRVRINAQLIDANSDVHLWADQYDRRVEDVFEIQREIAQRIASALQATLTPAERGEIEPTPTDNLDAYDYYLRAIDYRERGEREEDTRSAVEMLQQAVELDPEFAQAWAYLGELHSRVYWMYWDRSEERLNLAKEAAFRAFELQPGLGDAHRALGFYYYWGFLDYDRALEQFSLARNTLPNDAYVWAGIGWVLRRQGDWQGALNNLIKAVELNPRAGNTVLNLADTYALMRRYTESEPHYEKAVLLNPQDPDVYARLAWTYLAWHDSTEQARAVLRELSQNVDSAEVLSVGIRPRNIVPLIDFLDRDYVRAMERVSSAASDVLDTQFLFTPKTLLCAQIYTLMGETERAAADFDSARVTLEAELRERPDDHRIHGALGIAYAGLGRKEDAIREGARGVELMPVSKEAWKGVHRVQDLAQIYIMVGEYDAAIDQLDYLLSIPGEISVPLLRLDPTWDPLRDHPRFQALLARYE